MTRLRWSDIAPAKRRATNAQYAMTAVAA